VRFIRPLLQEWAYAGLYLGNLWASPGSPGVASDATIMSGPHTALGGSSPMPFLVNKVCGHYS